VWLQCFSAGPVLAAGDDENFFTHLHTEKVMANVTVSPGRAGPVNILIQLETVDELPLAAKAVSVTLTDAQSGKKIETAPAERIGENRWQTKATTLTAGRWTLGLGISMSDTDKVDVEAPILIASGAAKAESATKHHHH
jgi:copper transport protein